MVQYLVCSVLCLLLMLAAGPPLPAQQARPTPAEAFQRLKDGNNRFATDKLAARNLGGDRRAELTRGQHPFAVVLTCADSRVSPELTFDQGLGDLFVLRLAGNITDRGVVGSTEYAVDKLRTPLIVVLGHEGCGAVEAALKGKPAEGDLGWLVEQIHLGKDRPTDKAKVLPAATVANARYQAAELTRRSALLKKRIASKEVAGLVIGYFSLATGKVTWIDSPEDKAP